MHEVLASIISMRDQYQDLYDREGERTGPWSHGLRTGLGDAVRDLNKSIAEYK